ncbi:unnamed protein product [Urochloa humidicola]
MDLRSREEVELQFLFKHQAATIQEAAKNFLNKTNYFTPFDTEQLNSLFTDYITKAAVMADKLQLHAEPSFGEEAWSGGSSAVPAKRVPLVPAPPTVPVADAFKRIRDGIHVPSMMHTNSTHGLDNNFMAEQLAGVQQYGEGNVNGGNLIDLEPEHATMAGDFFNMAPESPVRAAAAEAFDADFIRLYREAHHSPVSTTMAQNAREEVEAPQDEPLLNTIFTKPTPALLQQPVQAELTQEGSAMVTPMQPKYRCRRVFDMTTPVEAALQEFLAMFQGPLPQQIIAALTAAFNLDDNNYYGELDEALAELAGEAIDDLAFDVANHQAEGSAVAA